MTPKQTSRRPSPKVPKTGIASFPRRAYANQPTLCVWIAAPKNQALRLPNIQCGIHRRSQNLPHLDYLSRKRAVFLAATLGRRVVSQIPQYARRKANVPNPGSLAASLPIDAAAASRMDEQSVPTFLLFTPKNRIALLGKCLPSLVCVFCSHTYCL